jgi:hypothetical protein
MQVLRLDLPGAAIFAQDDMPEFRECLCLGWVRCRFDALNADAEFAGLVLSGV